MAFFPRILLSVLLFLSGFVYGQSYTSLVNASNITLQRTVRLGFQTFHTQGMIKVGDTFFMSSVGVQEWPKRFDTPNGKYDRSTGNGTGYLFQFDASGSLKTRIELGRDSVYHPGGLDFDGTHLWVPVCEYRPKGKSWIYKIDAQSLDAVVAIEIDDAIGAVVYDRDKNIVIGMNWDARKLYRWKMGETKRWELMDVTTNPHYLLHFQDGQYLGNGKMLLSGIRNYTAPNNRVTVGGFQIMDTDNYQSLASIYLPFVSEKGRSLTNNPFYVEFTSKGALMYGVPDDDESLLYIYEVKE